jgi:O-antigen/teichoic acid export membrane protein
MAMSIVWIFLLVSDRHMGVIYATLFVWLAFLLYSIFKLAKMSKFVFKKNYLWYSMVFGLPLLPHALGGYILTYFDRIIIGQLTNMAEVGLYSFAYNVGLIMTIVIASISSAWTPMFFEQMNKKNLAKIEDITRKYAKMVFITALALVLFSREIITILAGVKYHAALEIVPIIILSYVFSFLYGTYLMYSEYRKKTWLISIATVIAAAFNIWLNYLLIPIYGYKIAAYTTFVSYVLLFILHYGTVRFVLKENAIRLSVFMPGLVALFSLSILFMVAEKITDSFMLLMALKLFILALMSIFLFKKLREKCVTTLFHSQKNR